MINSTVVFLLAAAGGAGADAAAAVSASTGTAAAPIGTSTHTVSSLYTGDRLRDPFLPAAAGASSPRRVERVEEGAAEGAAVPETVDIHGMTLRGIMKDATRDYALFSPETGGTFMLRAGKLYNNRNKPVPGIWGRIKLKQKTVELITADKDVQVFRLGEDEKEKEKP